jgi:hypothetical protein
MADCRQLIARLGGRSTGTQLFGHGFGRHRCDRRATAALNYDHHNSRDNEPNDDAGDSSVVLGTFWSHLDSHFLRMVPVRATTDLSRLLSD